MRILSVIASALCLCVLVGCSDDPKDVAASCVSKCEGDTRVTCGTDDSELRKNCAEQALHCALASGPAAICAASSERVPACAKRTSVCEGNWVTTCYDGYPLERLDCDLANKVCFGGSTEAACVVSATAEPKCAEQGSTWVCNGDVAIRCFEGRIAAKHDCSGCQPTADGVADSSGESCI